MTNIQGAILLWLAGMSIGFPILSRCFTERDEPAIAGMLIHFALFLLCCFYFCKE